MVDRCRTCKFFDKEGPYCRRHAPVPYLGLQGLSAFRANYDYFCDGWTDLIAADWPFVKEDDWCGEYENAQS
jgi:hypothetical protein